MCRSKVKSISYVQETPCKKYQFQPPVNVTDGVFFQIINAHIELQYVDASEILKYISCS